MTRVLALLAGLVTLGVATGVWPGSESICEQSCPDDDASGRCPAGCADCVCCACRPPLSAGAAASRLVPPAPSLGASLPTTLSAPHPSPDPLGILHIPKSSRA